ncbi:MAG: ATP-dependent dethiobiotin synthetase BioD [Bacteroides sp.]|nr:ATP-dependent dethiobiotin synthetase BioD [Bacteroides sp.]
MKRLITGIGTDVGKSYATGWLARRLMGEGRSVITQKLVQTGNVGRSEDIEVHRRIMQTGFLPEDREGLTAPLIYSYPASPHLAARIDGRPLDLSLADKSTEELEKRYDEVLIEGAGGLMVPLTPDYLTIDYAYDRQLPIILVTNGRLGSISDTLLTLDALRSRAMKLDGIIYNPFFDQDNTIADETQKYLRSWIETHWPGSWFEILRY